MIKISSDKIQTAAEALSRMLGKRVAGKVTDPQRPVNSDSTSRAHRAANRDVTPNGEYRQEGLSDPGIIGGVTGTGGGPLIR